MALTQSTLLKLRKNALQREMEASPPLMRAIAALQAQRLTALGDLLMLMNEDAPTASSPPCSTWPFSWRPWPTHQRIAPLLQQEIATLAGLSHGTASTLINKLLDHRTLLKSAGGMAFSSLEPLKKRGLLGSVSLTSLKFRAHANHWTYCRLPIDGVLLDSTLNQNNVGSFSSLCFRCDLRCALLDSTERATGRWCGGSFHLLRQGL